MALIPPFIVALFSRRRHDDVIRITHDNATIVIPAQAGIQVLYSLFDIHLVIARRPHRGRRGNLKNG